MFQLWALFRFFREHPIAIVYALGATCLLSLAALVIKAIDINQSVTVQATVIGGAPAGRGFHYPYLQYTTPAGQRVEAYARDMEDDLPPVGTIVTAYVNQSHPDALPVIKNFARQWLGTLIIFTLTLTLTIGCIIGIRRYLATAPAEPDGHDAESLVRAQRGAARYQAGDYAGAVEEWSRALDAGPSAALHERRGDAHAQLGNRRRAMEDYRQAARLYLQANDNDNLRRAIGKAESAQA
ncbi:MAG TPA: DUF3592 domain-containing protein [Herpetosiphonaceae bacterium]